jgi:catechol 2,3-dioxygenase-like lactoylglutathione lyase family enzyme
VRFRHVVLGAPPRGLDALGDFYEGLGFEIEPDRLLFRAGETTMEFDPARGEPFYHFAFLVPGDRFEAAFDWARARTELLPDEEGETVFDFDNWDAKACYFEDPAGNIVELAAHIGLDENGRKGDFEAGEIVGLSELGLVGDKQAMAAELEKLGFELWNGTLTEPDRLGFVGERGRTLILAPPGRGWVPTGRPAEVHPVEAVFAEGSAMLENGTLVITATSA